MAETKTAKDINANVNKEVVPIIKKYLDDLRYGYITLVVQDGVIIQVEKNEKIRLR